MYGNGVRNLSVDLDVKLSTRRFLTIFTISYGCFYGVAALTAAQGDLMMSHGVDVALRCAAGCVATMHFVHQQKRTFSSTELQIISIGSVIIALCMPIAIAFCLSSRSEIAIIQTVLARSTVLVTTAALTIVVTFQYLITYCFYWYMGRSVLKTNRKMQTRVD